MKVRIAVRGFADQKQIFEDRVDVESDLIEDVIPDLAAKHAEALKDHRLHMVEIEFIDDPEWVNVGEGGRSWMPEGAKVKRAASPARSRLVSPGALYAINPCTEEAARTAIEKHVHRPLVLIEAPPGARAAIVAASRDAELGVDRCGDCGEELESCICPL